MGVYKFEVFTKTIEQNIKDGVFKAGYKLPSVRMLKEQYGLSISTVQSGYDYLVLSGLVDNVPKSGYYVRSQPLVSVSNQRKRRPVIRDATFKKHLGLTTRSNERGRLSEFNVAAPGDLLVPQKLLLRTMQQVIREQGTNLLRYYPASGSIDLKSNIAQRAAAYQTILHPEELLVTDGGLQALYIALASVCAPGDVVAIETPCVFSVLEIIRVLKLKVIEIPTLVDVGFDIDFFNKACANSSIRAVVVTPNFHNPTGVLLSDDQKKRLLDLIVYYGIALIENDICGDLYFHGKRPSTIKGMDESGLVMSYSSYSKTLAPGIRLGWLAAGKFTQRAEQIRFALGSTVSPIYQETVSRLLSSSSYDRHLRTFRMQLARNAYTAIHLISSYLPEGTVVQTPRGGYNLWVQLPLHTDMEAFYKHCEEVAIRFTPGFTFSFSRSFDTCFRMVFADNFSDQKKESIQRLGERLR